MDTALIEGRFRGPAGVGNGGYVAGRMATALGVRRAEVTLRRGWPLDVPLTLYRTPDGRVEARDAEAQVIAEAREADLDLAPPPAPTPAEAEAATAWFLDSQIGRAHV